MRARAIVLGLSSDSALGRDVVLRGASSNGLRYILNHHRLTGANYRGLNSLALRRQRKRGKLRRVDALPFDPRVRAPDLVIGFVIRGEYQGVTGHALRDELSHGVVYGGGIERARERSAPFIQRLKL